LRRRSSVNRALDLLNGTASTTPSLASRVCRPGPLVLLVLLLAGGALAVYFIRLAVDTKALELHSYLTQQVLENSQLAAQQIRDVLVNTTDTVSDALAPVESLGNATNATGGDYTPQPRLETAGSAR
jgi:hypothetical protein